VERVNTQIRLITRQEIGLHAAHTLIALAMLTPHRALRTPALAVKRPQQRQANYISGILASTITWITELVGRSVLADDYPEPLSNDEHRRPPPNSTTCH
jgi:hypothetical protein